jgi:hypothetical protein
MPREVGEAYTRQTTLASAARTASGSAVITGDFGEVSSVIVYTRITAISGAGASLTVALEDNPDGGSVWYPLAADTARTAVGTYALRVPASTPFGTGLRLVYTLAGTSPSVTFQCQIVTQMPFS